MPMVGGQLLLASYKTNQSINTNTKSYSNNFHFHAVYQPPKALFRIIEPFNQCITAINRRNKSDVTKTPNHKNKSDQSMQFRSLWFEKQKHSTV